MGHSREKLDLTGQRFGQLTVLRPAENIGIRTAWLCRCDCGKETVVKTQHLRGGHTISCGCARRAALNNAQKHIGLYPCRRVRATPRSCGWYEYGLLFTEMDADSRNRLECYIQSSQEEIRKRLR